MMQVCVTGASGFLGKHFLAACLQRRDVAVRVLTRNPSAFLDRERNGLVVCSGDLLDERSCERFVAADATLVNLAYLNGDPKANLLAAANLARASLNAGAKRVVHCSTAAVVGFAARGVVSEDTPAEPSGEYQRTKYEIEQVLKASLLPHVELSILRPSEIIGTGGEGLRTMIRRVTRGRAGMNLLYRLLLKNRRFNYVAVDNVVGALLLLAFTQQPQRGDVYQISDDDDPDNNYAAVEALVRGAMDDRTESEVLNVGLPAPVLSFLYKLLPDSAPPDRIYAISKISSLGYEKTTMLRTAILDVIAHEAARRRADNSVEEVVAR